MRADLNRSPCLGYLSALAILISGLNATTADAASRLGAPQFLMAPDAGASPPEALPKVHSPRPYREAIERPCNESECTLKFAKVGNLHLLEISNVTCITVQSPEDVSKFFVLSRSPNLTKVRSLIAILPATGIAGNTITTSQSGPFYVDAGESPFLSASTPASGIGMICTISGTLWQTD